MRVLIVDDDEDAPELLADLIRTSGHAVEVVHDGPAALQIVVDFKPHLVLLDIDLPGMDGHQVAARIRESAVNVRLIAMTGYGDQFGGHFDAHLTKPLDYGVLESLLQGVD